MSTKDHRQRQLDCVSPAMLEYAELHRNLRHSPYARTLTFSCTAPQEFCGGLGDRLKGVVAAYTIAMMTGRVLLVDWDKPTKAEEIFRPGSDVWSHGIDWRLSSDERASIRASGSIGGRMSGKDINPIPFID